jgi:serine/threonine protein kinase
MEPKLIGVGSFGKVFRGYFKENPDDQVAIKCMPKKKLKTKISFVKNECQVLQKLDHPNIIKVKSLF